MQASPVIYVPSNHETYVKFRRRAEIDEDFRALATRHPGLHYFVCEGIEIDGVRFWGAPTRETAPAPCSTAR